MGEHPEEPEPRSYRWAQHKLRLSGALVGAAIVAAGVWTGMHVDHTITGTAVANPVGVVQAAAERQKAAEIAALEEQKRADEQFLTNLETEVLNSMRGYYADPANDFGDAQIVVSDVTLVKTADTQFEGMARMSAFGNDERDIIIHVTADDRSLMWSTDKGGLMPLLN